MTEQHAKVVERTVRQDSEIVAARHDAEMADAKALNAEQQCRVAEQAVVPYKTEAKQLSRRLQECEVERERAQTLQKVAEEELPKKDSEIAQIRSALEAQIEMTKLAEGAAGRVIVARARA